MADDQFQLNWWDTSRNRFENSTSTTETTSQQANSYGWSSEIVDLKSTSSMDHSLTASSTGHDHRTPNDLHMMGLGLSSTNQNMADWNNQGLLGEKSAGSSFRSLIQEDHLSSNPSTFEAGPSSSGVSSQEQHWRLQRALYTSSCEQDHSPSVNEFKQINRGFSLDHHHHHQSQFVSGDQTSSNENASSQNNLNVVNFQHVDSAAAYGLLLAENQQQHTSNSYDQYAGNNNSDPLMASWNKYQNFLRTSPPKQQLHFTNNTPFWNATAVNNDPRPSFFSTQNIIPVAPSYNDEKPKVVASEVATTKKHSTAETSNKRPRNEATSSSLPAFKVRKEKMGDRITALQQLVSPFGKTDTASVLSEAIQYIKFLHEQVSVLSTPYMKNGNPPKHQQQISDKSKQDQEGPRQDLRSRGLCLVPVSSTFPMTHETTVDFWTPTFGGTFR